MSASVRAFLTLSGTGGPTWEKTLQMYWTVRKCFSRSAYLSQHRKIHVGKSLSLLKWKIFLMNDLENYLGNSTHPFIYDPKFISLLSPKSVSFFFSYQKLQLRCSQITLLQKFIWFVWPNMGKSTSQLKVWEGLDYQVTRFAQRYCQWWREIRILFI